jgi:hypothetical protein
MHNLLDLVCDARVLLTQTCDLFEYSLFSRDGTLRSLLLAYGTTKSIC